MGANRRLEAKRWELVAKSQRAAVIDGIPNLEAVPGFRWCGFEESNSLTAMARVLSPRPDRVMQRWGAGELVAALSSDEVCDGLACEVAFLLDDHGGAGWAWGRGLEAIAALASALPAMRDGFGVISTSGESILYVDVVEISAQRQVETTLIGEEFPGIRRIFAGGPEPLTIWG